MSNSQPAVTKKTKRPRGLLASRKATNHMTESEPVAKKARSDDAIPQDPEELKVQDWQDLDELFENALDALYGPNWTSALPLIRGVLHECARLVSVHGDPTLIYSPLEGDISTNSEQTPASAFFVIYASAWLIMSTFARDESSLLTEDEPEDPLGYILSALAACEKGQQALDVRKQPKDWGLELIWGRALVAASQNLAGSKDEPQASESETADARAQLLGQDSFAVLDRAFEHLTYAVRNHPRPTGSSSGIEDEQKLKGERFVRVLVETAQGILAVSESLQSGERSSVRYLEGARELLHHAEEMTIPVELQIQVTQGLGQVSLAIGSAIAEELEVDSDDEANSVKEEPETRAAAVKSLKEAIAKFDAVSELCAKQSDRRTESIVEEVKPMLQEALVTLATLLPEGPEQESMYSRYQAEGGDLDGED